MLTLTTGLDGFTRVYLDAVEILTRNFIPTIDLIHLAQAEGFGARLPCSIAQASVYGHPTSLTGDQGLNTSDITAIYNGGVTIDERTLTLTSGPNPIVLKSFWTFGDDLADTTATTVDLVGTANLNVTNGTATIVTDSPTTISIAADIDQIISDWNAANPGNTVTLSSGDGTQIPTEDLILTGGVDGSDIDQIISDWNAANPGNTVTLSSGDGSQIPTADLILTGGVDGSEVLGGGVAVEGFGVFYKNENMVTPVNSEIYRHMERFVGDVDNLDTFTLGFLPDPRLLNVYEINTGQTYRYGAFVVSGNQVIFEPDTFNKPENVVLEFLQVQGGSFDNSDKNIALLANNHLGSADSSIDLSVAGRGIFLRKPNGELVEAVINDYNEWEFWSI
jgi:hypothetical protein